MVLLVILVMLELTVMLVTQELVPLLAVLVDRVIPVAMVMLVMLGLMETLVLTGTREVQRLLSVTQTI